MLMQMALSPPKGGFAFLPDDGRPDRIIRFTSLDVDSLVARLDWDRNVLLVDRQRFDLLSNAEQGRVLGTHDAEVYVRAMGDRVIVE